MDGQWQEMTVENIERQAKRMDEQADNFAVTVDKITTALRNLSNKIMNEDSNLAHEIDAYADILQEQRNKGVPKYQELASIMHKYGASSLQNEQEMSQYVSEQISVLEQIKQTLESIV